jgi:hypothetical protein
MPLSGFPFMPASGLGQAPCLIANLIGKATPASVHRGR